MTDDYELTVTKHTAYVMASQELLMDVGAIPDTRPPVHVPWHRRLRRWLWGYDRREQLGRWAYKRITGWDFPESDD